MLSDGETIFGFSFFLCLNPCSNGICSLMAKKTAVKAIKKRLNPCSNGICSLISPTVIAELTEEGLNPCSNGICSLITYRERSDTLLQEQPS